MSTQRHLLRVRPPAAEHRHLGEVRPEHGPLAPGRNGSGGEKHEKQSGHDPGWRSASPRRGSSYFFAGEKTPFSVYRKLAPGLSPHCFATASGAFAAASRSNLLAEFPAAL